MDSQVEQILLEYTIIHNSVAQFINGEEHRKSLKPDPLKVEPGDNNWLAGCFTPPLSVIGHVLSYCDMVQDEQIWLYGQTNPNYRMTSYISKQLQQSKKLIIFAYKLKILAG